MTPCFFLWLFQILQAHSLLGETFQSPNIIKPLRFPELTREVLEKIKKATGQPIDTNRFMPFLSASSKDVTHYQPFSRKSKYLKQRSGNKQTGGFSDGKSGKKGEKNEKGHFNEVSKNSKKGKESEEREFEDVFGEEHQFLEERFFKRNHQEEDDGDGEEKFKNGRKRGRYFVKKGYRDIFHRDETKKSDSFWDKLHEEGKWFHYGLRNKKKEKKEKTGEEEKKVEDQKESSDWGKEMSTTNKKEEKEISRKVKETEHESITL